MYNYPHQPLVYQTYVIHNEYQHQQYSSFNNEKTFAPVRQNQNHPNYEIDSSHTQNKHPSLASQSDVVLSEQSQESTSGKKTLSTKKVNKKTPLDTSNFSVEERLVAAVWVHERKLMKCSISQIKRDFQQRFGRQAPAKNTLLVWERKLFSTGSVHDAYRSGRPVKRGSAAAAVAASVRGAPAVSQRARARALRLPRSTLRTILLKDMTHSTTKVKKRATGKQTRQTKGKKKGTVIL